MTTLRLRAGFKAAYTMGSLFFLLVFSQTNRLCAQNNPNQLQRLVLPQLQALKQKQPNKTMEQPRIKNAASPADNRATGNQRTYTFTGKGSWFTASNWENNTVPPAQLKSGDRIVINGSGACVLNNAKPISFTEGSSIEVSAGKQLYVTIAGNFMLNNGTLVNNGKITILSGTLSRKSNSSNTAEKAGVLKTTPMSKLDRRTLATSPDKQ